MTLLAINRMRITSNIMWRSKTPALKTANLCNEFLIAYLSKKKAQLEKLGLLKKSYVYHTAILSIKKYPLPIVSPQQLRLLYGVGDLLSQELVIVIRNHYRQFLKEPKLQGQAIEEEPEEQLNLDDSRSRGRAVTAYQKCESQEDVSEDRSCRSVRSENVERDYRPRPNTQAANILLEMGQMGREFVGEEELRKNLKSLNHLNAGKKYNTTLANLLKSNYIERNEREPGCIRLTERGASELAKLQHKTKIKTSLLKIQSLLTSFREAKQHAPQAGAPKLEERDSKPTIKLHPDKHLVLVIDSREVKDKQQQCFFEGRLREKHGVACVNANLPIGDFAWLYDGQVLDYIVERKKADDLLSSILDGRYKEQKFRLRHSGFTNIFYLFEGHLKGANTLSERSVQTALLKTRVKDEFKVVSVKTISESVRFLSFLTASIEKRLQTEGKMATIGSFEAFVQNSAKGSNVTVRQIFGLSLKTIPGVGKNAVGEVLRYFGSFRELHRQLRQLGCSSEREEFLRELLRGSGVPRQLPKVLVDILFDCPKN